MISLDQTLEWFPDEIKPALPRGADDAPESDASATGSSSHDSSMSDSDLKKNLKLSELENEHFFRFNKRLFCLAKSL